MLLLPNNSHTSHKDLISQVRIDHYSLIERSAFRRRVIRFLQGTHVLVITSLIRWRDATRTFTSHTSASNTSSFHLIVIFVQILLIFPHFHVCRLINIQFVQSTTCFTIWLAVSKVIILGHCHFYFFSSARHKFCTSAPYKIACICVFYLVPRCMFKVCTTGWFDFFLFMRSRFW